MSVDRAAKKIAKKPNANVDVKELRAVWTELSDMHDFPRLLNYLGISQEEALKLIGNDSAYRISVQSV